MQATVKLYDLGYAESKIWLAATLFIVGNITLPQLFHLIPQGGVTWLPIYFFTLVGAYKYGWKLGLLTAIASPFVNSLIFGMPAFGSLPAILLKSVLLAIAAGYAAQRWQKVSLPLILAVVLFYQIIGTLYRCVGYAVANLRWLSVYQIPDTQVMMFGIGTQEIVLIILIVLLFFGGRKIPELMKGLGKGIRSFKEGVRGIENATEENGSGKMKEEGLGTS